MSRGFKVPVTECNAVFARKEDLIILQWRRAGSDSAGAVELARINRALIEEFGKGGGESPASIARVLADSGIRLRHPEVLEADTQWREAQLISLFDSGEIAFVTIAQAVESMSKLTSLYESFIRENDRIGAEQLRELAREVKLEIIGGPKTGREPLEGEVLEWLTIWLQTPEIFTQWLELRLKSPDFRKKFKY